MRPFLLSISMLAICLALHAQNRPPTVDSFFASFGFSTVRLLLTEDGNFFIAESNCTTANIARGRWISEKGVTRLLPCNKENNSIKPTLIQADFKVDDTSQVLKIVDCFSKIMPYYSITLYDSIGRFFQYWADEKGVIKINKNKFKSFFTEDEISEFDFRNNILDYAHPLLTNKSGIIVTFNYPVEILRDRPSTQSTDYRGAEFVKTKKGLQYKNSVSTLLKL